MDRIGRLMTASVRKLPNFRHPEERKGRKIKIGKRKKYEESKK